MSLIYDQFSVRVADNGIADSKATLTDAIHTNLSGNTAFGKNTFVGGYRLEVEGNTLVNGTLTVNVIPAKTTEAGVYLTHENNTIKTRTAAQVRSDIGAAAVNHNHAWNDITGKPTGTTNYITMFTNGATGAIGNSQLSQNTDGVIASKGITANDFLQSNGPLFIRSHISLLNKAGNAWLDFVTRDVSGSEAVVDLSNVRNIIPAGSGLGIGGNTLVNGNATITGSISMISPSTNNTMELYVDSSRNAAGINAQTGLLEIRNTSTATNGDILIQSVASDINISSLGESGEISLDAKRVKISRRNLKSQTFTYTVNGSYIIDLNNYYDVNLFIINSTADWVSIGFKNATVGDEIHVNIKGYGAVAYQRDPNSGNAWREFPNDPIKLDEFFYKLICTGTDNYYGQTINTWIIGS
jgi:hypothetical protein